MTFERGVALGAGMLSSLVVVSYECVPRVNCPRRALSTRRLARDAGTSGARLTTVTDDPLAGTARHSGRGLEPAGNFFQRPTCSVV